MTAGNWQSALGALLDAVPPDADRFVLNLLAQRDADGDPFTDLLPDAARERMNNEYLDYWWANTGTAQSGVWIGHRWRVLRAEADSLTITFARIDGE